MKKIIAKLGSLSLVSGLFAASAFATSAVYAQDEAERPFEGEHVTVGVVGDAGEQVWEAVAEVALEQEGIEIEVVLLTDYNQPNEALNNGSLDINSFQHVAFLNDWNSANDADLTYIGYTSVNPLGLYSEKYTDLSELPEEGAIIAIPNDPTNGGRALLALEIAGFIELDDAAGVLPTPDDIIDNPQGIVIEELEASQISLALPDVDAAFINTGFANDAGLTLEDAIFFDAEDVETLNEVYKNIIAVRAEDKENPLYLKLVEIYQTPETAALIVETSNGGSIPAWDGAADYADEESDAETTEEESTETDSETDTE